jgi:hypothetical protein
VRHPAGAGPCEVFLLAVDDDPATHEAFPPEPGFVIPPDLILEDETNSEFFERVHIAEFLLWMRKGGYRLPQSVDETHRLIYEWLLHRRREMIEQVNKRRENQSKRRKGAD